jgi:hypothetical protein
MKVEECLLRPINSFQPLKPTPLYHWPPSQAPMIGYFLYPSEQIIIEKTSFFASIRDERNKNEREPTISISYGNHIIKCASLAGLKSSPALSSFRIPRRPLPPERTWYKGQGVKSSIEEQDLELEAVCMKPLKQQNHLKKPILYFKPPQHRRRDRRTFFISTSNRLVTHAIPSAANPILQSPTFHQRRLTRLPTPNLRISSTAPYFLYTFPFGAVYVALPLPPLPEL